MSLIRADARAIPLRDESVQCVVTSPPYWGLRDYGVTGQLGLEDTPDAYVEALTGAFREVRRVLRDDGIAWVNLGDSYSGGGRGGNPGDSPHVMQATNTGSLSVRGQRRDALKPKDLVGIPWRVAFALQADGWWLRSDVIWAKPNPMPESVTDRPTKSHEYVFLLAKSKSYFYDAAAIAERATGGSAGNVRPGKSARTPMLDGGRYRLALGEHAWSKPWDTCNRRSVWTFATQPTPEAHFATFPETLARICVLAGSRPGDVVLDPFVGSGTTVRVARGLGRHGVGLDLSAAYLHTIARERIKTTLGLGL